MNRYLVRSLVAVLAFFIGVAVSSALRPSRTHFRHRDRDCYRKKAEYSFRHHGKYSSFRTASVLVDAVSTDPLKLAYSNTSSNSRDVGKQRVEFDALNVSKKNIDSYSISYVSRFSGSRAGGGGGVTMDKIGRNGSLLFSSSEIVGIECQVDETLIVWVSSVEFSDGSRWINPRH